MPIHKKHCRLNKSANDIAKQEIGLGSVDILKNSTVQMLFPTFPFIPDAHQRTVPVCEVIVPVPNKQRHERFSTYKILPPGMPDYLQVDIAQREEGTERCIAAVYGARAYLIHYELKPR